MKSNSFIHPSILHAFPCGLCQTLCWILDVRDSDQDPVALSRRPQSSGRQGPVLQGEVFSPSDWGAGEGFLEEWYVIECWKENRSLAHWGKGAFTGAGKISGKNLNTAWLSRGKGLNLSGAKCFSRGIVPWRGKWQPTPVFLQGKSHGQGAWKATVHGVAKSQTRLKQLSYEYKGNSQSWAETEPQKTLWTKNPRLHPDVGTLEILSRRMT